MAFHSLPARPLLGRGALGKARALWTLGRSALGARKMVRQIGAEVVLGTGGYVSAGAVLGGRLAGLPVLLLEPNAEAGIANLLALALGRRSVPPPSPARSGCAARCR